MFNFFRKTQSDDNSGIAAAPTGFTSGSASASQVMSSGTPSFSDANTLSRTSGSFAAPVSSTVVPPSYIDAYVPPTSVTPPRSAASPTSAMPSSPVASPTSTNAHVLPMSSSTMQNNFVPPAIVGGHQSTDVRAMDTKSNAASRPSISFDPPIARLVAPIMAKAEPSIAKAEPVSSSAQYTPQWSMPAPMTSPAADAAPYMVAAAPMASSAPATSPAADTTSLNEAPSATTVSSTLEDQNIFFLLGIDDAADKDKEQFLDDLQKVIWNDFLQRDLELLITEEEMEQMKVVSQKPGMTEEAQQVAIIEYLEGLIPDLERIMLDKALELKADMFRERIRQLLELYKDKQSLLLKVQDAQRLLNEEDNWRQSADILNSLQ